MGLLNYTYSKSERATAKNINDEHIKVLDLLMQVEALEEALHPYFVAIEAGVPELESPIKAVGQRMLEIRTMCEQAITNPEIKVEALAKSGEYRRLRAEILEKLVAIGISELAGLDSSQQNPLLLPLNIAGYGPLYADADKPVNDELIDEGMKMLKKWRINTAFLQYDFATWGEHVDRAIEKGLLSQERLRALEHLIWKKLEQAWERVASLEEKRKSLYAKDKTIQRVQHYFLCINALQGVLNRGKRAFYQAGIQCYHLPEDLVPEEAEKEVQKIKELIAMNGRYVEEITWCYYRQNYRKDYRQWLFDGCKLVDHSLNGGDFRGASLVGAQVVGTSVYDLMREWSNPPDMRGCILDNAVIVEVRDGRYVYTGKTLANALGERGIKVN